MPVNKSICASLELLVDGWRRNDKNRRRINKLECQSFFIENGLNRLTAGLELVSMRVITIHLQACDESV